eukprot:CAMPEP_0171780636 /NCGR_PEP_ID=MMETSP0991-20121206/59740_1 /TAXON_ID=483369 /ORGANISM="non described non described, Strain CCMP2098" /LENGTH=57 /DNA_ID=CAMNT_0012388069 /DNA_START=113 /DNA_END=282 /DNA_ORIENTATION=-
MATSTSITSSSPATYPGSDCRVRRCVVGPCSSSILASLLSSPPLSPSFRAEAVSGFA